MATGDRAVTRVGVIGVGNMGSALVRGWVRGGAAGLSLVVWDKVEELAASRAASSATDSTGCVSVQTATSLDDLIEGSEAIFVVVKPKDAPALLGTLAGRLTSEHTVVSAMAGLTLAWIRNALGPGPSLLRVMPNLAVGLGAGVLGVSVEPGSAEERIRQVVKLLRPLGLVEVVQENQLDAVTALAGSGPGFLAIMMEALEDGAVAAGMSRDLARVLVRWAAKDLSRRLSEQGGSTIAMHNLVAGGGIPVAQGVEVLVQREVRGAFAGAITAAWERSCSLSRGR